MIPYRSFTILILYSILIISCTKEKIAPIDPNQTTIILSNPISFNYRSIKLAAEIKYLNKRDTIIEHGFVIQSTDDDSYPPKTFVIESDARTGIIHYSLPNSNGFRDNKTYKYHYYIKTNFNTWKTEEKEIGFTRIIANSKSGLYHRTGEFIEIEGDFLDIKDEYILFYDFKPEEIVPYELLNDSKLIRFKVPEDNYHGVYLHFRLKKKNNNSKDDAIFIAQTIVLGTVIPPSKYELYYNDVIDAKSIDFSYGLSGELKLFVGQRFITYSPYLTFGYLIHNQQGNSFPIGYTNGRDTIIFPEKISLILPNEKDFRTIPPIVHPNSSFKISGLDMNKTGGGLLKVGDKAAQLINNYMTYDNNILTIGDLSDGDYSLTLNTSNFNYSSLNKIKVQSLRIYSINPIKAQKNSIVKLVGNFVVDQSYQILLNNKVISEVVCKKINELEFLIKDIQDLGVKDIRISYRNVQTSEFILSADKLTLEII